MRLVAVVAAVAVLMAACGDDGPEEVRVPVVDAAEDPAGAAGSADDAGNDAGGVDTAENDGTAPPTTTGAVPANGDVVDVVALDNTFRPETIEVVAGTAIRWENRGRNDHNVIPTDETASWGAPTEAFAPGDEYTHLFDTPGNYPYYCTIHATPEVGMIGTVVVLPADR